MNPYVTVGLSVLAGAALLEVALIPGIVIGGAAVLAPEYLPRLRRRLRTERRAPPPGRRDVKPPADVAAGLAIKKSLAKTISFRVIASTLDFTANYLVIGELATAAGLSTFALVAGPIFYFAHETAWNYYLGPSGKSVDLPALPSLSPDAEAGRGGLTISRALAKTITFRTIATAMDFTTNYVVVGDLVTAVGLSAFGFVVGPFVYIAHEKVWDHYSSRGERTLNLPPPPNRVAVIGPSEGGSR
jgi:uncharacterized membrane protein